MMSNTNEIGAQVQSCECIIYSFPKHSVFSFLVSGWCPLFRLSSSYDAKPTPLASCFIAILYFLYYCLTTAQFAITIGITSIND